MNHRCIKFPPSQSNLFLQQEVRRDLFNKYGFPRRNSLNLRKGCQFYLVLIFGLLPLGKQRATNNSYLALFLLATNKNRNARKLEYRIDKVLSVCYQGWTCGRFNPLIWNTVGLKNSVHFYFVSKCSASSPQLQMTYDSL